MLQLVPEKIGIVVETVPDSSADISEFAAAGIEQVTVNQGSWQVGKHAHGNGHDCEGQCLLKMRLNEANSEINSV